MGEVSGSVVHDLLGRREAVLDVYAVDVTNVITKPAVERILRRGHPLECRVEVIGLPVHDRHIRVRRLLDEERFSGDTKSLARSLVGVAALPPPASIMADRSVSVLPGSRGAMNPIEGMTRPFRREILCGSGRASVASQNITRMHDLVVAGSPGDHGRQLGPGHLEDVTQVRVHRVRRDMQPSRDLSVCKTLGH
jgi:hypothetical protein